MAKPSAAAKPAAAVNIQERAEQQLVLISAYQAKIAKALADPDCKPGSKEFREVTSGLALADKLLARARLFRRK